MQNSPSLPKVIDQAAKRLYELSKEHDWKRNGGVAAIETASRIYAISPPPAKHMAGLEAAEYLQTIIPQVQNDILQQHEGYGAIRWFWYLRRIPDIFFEGSYGTTRGYDQFLAEMLSAQFKHKDVGNVQNNHLSFRVDEAAFRHLAKYVGRVKLLSGLHTLYRRVGKGAVLDATSPILMADTTKALEEAIQTYDIRHDRSHEFIGAGLGIVTIDANFHNQVANQTVDSPLAYLSRRVTPAVEAPLPIVDGTGRSSTAIVNIRHLLSQLSIDRILNPIGAEGGTPSYLKNTAPLIQLLLLIPIFCIRFPWVLSSISQYGYFFISEKELSDTVNGDLEEITGTVASFKQDIVWPKNYVEWRDSLKSLTPSLWPLACGDVIRQFEANYLIDVTGASQALLQKIEFTRSPIIGNIRAKTFELQCQEVIDSTLWEPPKEVKAIRGRQLRINSKLLTDIDAIGAKQGTLLIISCKSIIYDRNYDLGKYQVIQNAQSTVDEAVVAWNKILSQLREIRKGDNFDFTTFNEIVGVVCTPFAVYTSNEKSLAFVKADLRACSSVLELRDWLNKY